ncbi:calcium binding modulator protein (Alg2) [Aspergillus arachidicola]|uniref:Calcium binding modulator protein (Alg2) n=1 Tax=Aspergillus arachidicola TaxID=656916 RepID=A0A2G7FWR4_9EURO|nr:calcium binding modulator protein (Alg2) [Aspergillus arachidicola]
MQYTLPVDPTVSFAGKTVVLTGATSGLGFEAAIKLLNLGVESLIIGSRSLERGDATKTELEKRTTRQGVIQVWELDMNSFQSVKTFASRIQKEIKQLDIALLNAGLCNKVYTASPEGWEETLQVNALSTSLLALLLLPKLRDSSSDSNPAHLAVVSSQQFVQVKATSLRTEGSLLEHLNDPRHFSGTKQYGISKLLLEYVLKTVADRVRNENGTLPVIVNTISPGLCVSSLGRQYDRFYERWVVWLFYKLFARTAEQGSRSIVAQMIGAMQTGPQHHHNQGKPARPSPNPSSSGVPPRVPVTSAHMNKPLPAPAANQHRTHPLHPSPPPQNYGFGPPPSQPVRNRPQPSSRPPRSPNPPLAVPDDDPQQLFPLFRAANSSHTGSLTEMELGSALVNGDFTSFHPKTVKMMIRMFDRNSSGTISFDEFVSLWRYLAAWRELFDRFDVDRSGRISLQEFENALLAFGYRLSQPFVTVLFTTFESKGRQMNGPAHPAKMGMSFDLFVQACISLRRMTDVFKRYDDDRDGYITVSFEEFLTEILQLQD